jgi:flagellar biosynthesis protein FlhA
MTANTELKGSTVSLGGIQANSDIFIALGTMGILIVMVIPLPTVLLDLLLAFNITVSLVVLLVAIYTISPLEFSVFPSLLLLATLFRLSLNVASTRLILLYGQEGPLAAGKIIKSFGSFVVGGNYLVGIIIFFILVVINFVVITKGAGRVAEVAARFTLDAMPGKQMSIDADLSSGLITEEEALRRRRNVESEADFYGAMDGASKFIRGDAIAGVIITLINIVGGLVIGVLQAEMSLVEALQTYTLLTVGDGLVSQIPALVVSTAAGIVVTRVASETNLGQEFATQLFQNPRAGFIAAGLLVFFGLVPGLPMIPFFTLAGLTGLMSYMVMKSSVQEEVEKPVEAEFPRAMETMDHYLVVDPLGLEVGYGLIPLVDADQNGELLERIRNIRRQLVQDMGFILPPFHIKDNLRLEPGEYLFLLRGVEVARAKLMLNHSLVLDPDEKKPLPDSIPTKEPTFGLPALWIPDKALERAQLAGYTVVNHSTIVTTHLTELLKQYAHELLGRQEVQTLLDNLAERAPKVVEELVPNLLTLGQVQKVLQNLLKERVSVQDLLTILETLADCASVTKDPAVLTEYVRQRLGRSIVRSLLTPDGKLPIVTLDPEFEESLANTIQSAQQGAPLSIDPADARNLIRNMEPALEPFVVNQYEPVLMTSPLVRQHVKRLSEGYFPQLTVLSYEEVPNKVQLIPLGVIKKKP